MEYNTLRDFIGLLEEFEQDNLSTKLYSQDINGFKQWVIDNERKDDPVNEPDWEGKESGRSAESVISTLIVHMNRYAKSYSRAAILGSEFSTQEDFIYLINLKTFGAMTKMDLIKKNVHEKPAGIKIINRLIAQGWISQLESDKDKRSKTIRISTAGLAALDQQMDHIRRASKIVAGDLLHREKMELIRILTKLNDFHQPIYLKNIEPQHLLTDVLQDY